MDLLSKVAGATFLLISFQACDQSRTPPTMEQAKSMPSPDYQRFLPIAPMTGSMMGVPWHGYFALDTKTGQLCKAMAWEFQGNKLSGFEGIVNGLPLCKDLFGK
jgi:hypothetical protein